MTNPKLSTSDSVTKPPAEVAIKQEKPASLAIAPVPEFDLSESKPAYPVESKEYFKPYTEPIPTKKVVIKSEELPPMSAISAIINPLTALKGGKTKVSIYSSLVNDTLGFEQRFLGETVGKLKGGKSTLKVLNRSNMISMLLDDTVHVYGVNTENNLCLLNPAYQPISEDKPLANGMFAGCSDGESEGWIFYQKYNASADASDLYERTVTGTNANVKKLDGIPYSLKDTKLAACYDGDNRWLAYQNATNCIVLRNIDTDKEAVIENTRWTAMVRTPLSVVYVPGHDTRGHVFVYYLHADSSLRRAFVEIDDTVEFKGYGQEAVVEKAANIPSWTQLSIIADPNSKTNYVYTVKDQANAQVSTIADNWGVSIQKLQEYYHSQLHHNHLVGTGSEGDYHLPGHGHHAPHFKPGKKADSHYHFPGYEGGFHSPGKGLDEHHHHHDRRPPPYVHRDYHPPGPGYTHGHPLNGMSDLDFELGKVNLNALLKLCFNEPRVEYNRQYYNPQHHHH